MPNGVPMSWLRTSYDHPPLFVAEGKGARFRDADGHEYSDFNIADMSMFAGYAPEPVVEAVSRRVAQGTQFLLPNEDALWVAEELGRRYGLPKWQFTLSATHANTEAIRVARALDRPRQGPVLRREVPRPFRRGARRPAGRAARPEEGGLPRDVTSQDEDRAVQRPRRAAGRPRAARRRDRDHGAGADEQHRAAAAGARVPRRAPRHHAGDRHGRWRTTRRTPRSSVRAG